MAVVNQRRSGSAERYRRGVTAYLQGDYTQAVEDLEPLAGPKSPMSRTAARYVTLAHRQLGFQALQDSRFDRAEHHLRAAMKTAGPQADLSDRLARLYARNGRFNRCADELERATDVAGDQADLRRKLAQAQWRAGRRSQAYMTLLDAMRQLGPLAEFHLQLGLFYSAEGRFAEARASFARAAEADSSSQEAHHYLGLAAASMGDMPAALKSLQRALELRPDDLMLAYQLVLSAKAAHREGVQYVLRLPDSPASPGGSQMQQFAHYLVHEPEFIEAVLANDDKPANEEDQKLLSMLLDVLGVALRGHANYADLYCHCSRILQRLGRLEEAVQHAQQALEINPQYTRALVQLGKLQASLGRRAEAVDCLERAIAAGGDWPDLHCLAGELLIESDQPQAARRHLGRALEINAHYKRAADALAKLAA